MAGQRDCNKLDHNNPTMDISFTGKKVNVWVRTMQVYFQFSLQIRA